MQILLRACLVFFSLLAADARGSQEASWTWILSSPKDRTASDEAHAFAKRMFAFFQKRSIMPGRLVELDELSQLPEGPTVFIGPLGGFAERPAWLGGLVELGAPAELRGGPFAAAVAGVGLSDPETGLYVRSADGTRVLYSGLSNSGFQGIFSTPTGRFAATVTCQGRVSHEGSYVDGALVLSPRPAVQKLPRLEELEEELAGVGDPGEAVQVSDALGPGGAVSEAYAERLRALTLERRVLFFGEQHWNSGVNGLFARTFDWLLEERGVSTLFLESSYSHSAHFQAYVSLPSDEEAQAFWVSELRPLVIAQSTRDVLDGVRIWSRAHPKAPVRVACLDIEFDFHRTISSALAGYFVAHDGAFRVALGEKASAPAVRSELRRLRERLQAHRSEEPRHPWMTADFVERALVNLEESLDGLGRPSRMADRQRSILRNVTEFHGEAFSDAALARGLVVFKEGSAHAWKDAHRDDGAFWEATYLQHHFEPTKGRVASLFAEGLGYHFGRVLDVDLATHKRWATVYHRFLDDFRWSLRAGVASEDGLYFVGESEPSGVEAVVLMQALAGMTASQAPPAGQGRALLLGSISEEALGAAGLRVGDGSWNRFDEVVYVVGGALEPSLLRAEPR